MPKRGLPKKIRQKLLLETIAEDPFLNDEELAERFNVSVQTIRLDRMELKLPELRERIRAVAQDSYAKVKSIDVSEIVGELVDLELDKRGISILETNNNMTFGKTKVIRGDIIFAQANSLAIATIDAKVALTGVANIKYKLPVYAGQKLVAKAEVTRVRGNKKFVFVRTYVKQKEVFRGKFILASLEDSIEAEE
ncbi:MULTISPECIES: transcription factor FapR [Tepidanaerobacter]|uniref:DeoR-like helix-turn-helix domain-containing protein n=1 Tax=Tepidanaerobacter syntrophicus TaxID=224999 RepID=A0A0U9HHT9_9FIRM|nr:MULTISPECIES: transcription factor FapR [Tepidanaerobacter]GAQ26301.1 DeoR-like helix-turn-helix domain-containing protein [Tepidanaerobacter syntrophicus]GLI19289.1 transcription factor FapR [Tepidanaerobacter syntrophicus]GLI50077.1 transcription factor FapR [Tepidanaerobacter syntrophicus]HHV84181.1 transcription factor FapR [Tepidanaerobacter syntrophicus]